MSVSLTDSSRDTLEKTTVLVVCDGWTYPKHPRKVLKDGDPTRVSHGLCEECAQAMELSEVTHA